MVDGNGDDEDGDEALYFQRAAQYLRQWDTVTSSTATTSSKSSLLDQPWSTLSGGQVQLVTLALTLALQPTVLLLDESTSALDKATVLAVEQTLLQQTTMQPQPQQNPTKPAAIVMVSHDQRQTQRFSNRMFTLQATTENTPVAINITTVPRTEFRSD